MERQILKELDFQLLVPTIYTFLLRFLKASHADAAHESNVKLHVEAISKVNSSKETICKMHAK